MTSRIPPSRRDPLYASQRAAKVVQQQTPGAGRVAGVARPGVSEAVAAYVRGRPTGSSTSTGGGSASTFARDRFLLTASGAQTKYLSSIPAAESQHAYLNGVQLDEGTDYSLTGNALALLSAAGVLSGDVLDVRYAVGGAVVTYADSVLADAPYLYWPFDETSGTTAVDGSGNGRDGTVGTGVTLGAAGLGGGTGGAFTFTTTADGVQRGEVGGFGGAARTVEAIIKTSNTVGGHWIVRRDDGFAQRSFQFRVEAGVLELILIAGATVFCTGTTLVADGLAHHVAGTWDGTTVSIYIDGALEQSVSQGTASAPAVNEPFVVGGSFDGVIDEVALYETALSPARIAAHAAAAEL